MNVIDVATELVRRPSLTPNDAGCLDYIQSLLEPFGFVARRIDCDGVTNLWMTRGSNLPRVVFAGHCDVVPTGPTSDWTSHPFEPQIRDGFLFGRGSADMKGSLAAMIVALAKFANENPDAGGATALLVTSDEEGLGVYGTQYVLDTLLKEGVQIDYALVGEPTSESVLGDTIKVGRRGSLGCRLKVQGIQGHVAYPHLANNPIHVLLPFLAELVAVKWDQGGDGFDPSTLQISNIHAGTGASNVIPGEATLDFNIRYSPMITAEEIKTKILHMAKVWGLDADWEWNNSALPFVTTDELLTNAIQSAVKSETGRVPKLGTGGGTSDARFFANHHIPVIEFGPLNKTIHAVNECVSTDDLESCVKIFEQTLGLLTSS